MLRRLVTVTALALTLAACGDSSKSPEAVDAQSWAERVCQSIEGQAALLAQAPDIDASDPAKAKENLLGYLENLAKSLDTLIHGVKDAGTPKVADGSQVVTKVTNTLQEAKSGVDTAKSNLEKATVTDAASFQAARDKVGADLAKLSDLEDPTKDLKANGELNDAFNKAPTCTKLDQSGPSSPPTT